jgi:mannose-6-phosphate isomerase-like protein (cupin superfamily)
MGLELMRSGQWQPGGKTAVEYQGFEHNSQVTLIIEDMPSGGGPRLHKHPYGEVWVVIAGCAAFTDGQRTVEAGVGDVMYVGAETPHKFTSIGEGSLRMVCIHESPKFHTDWLEPKAT